MLSNVVTSTFRVSFFFSFLLSPFLTLKTRLSVKKGSPIARDLYTYINITKVFSMSLCGSSAGAVSGRSSRRRARGRNVLHYCNYNSNSLNYISCVYIYIIYIIVVNRHIITIIGITSRVYNSYHERRRSSSSSSSVHYRGRRVQHDTRKKDEKIRKQIKK